MDVPGGWTNCMEVFRETKAKGWIWLIIPEGENVKRGGTRIERNCIEFLI